MFRVLGILFKGRPKSRWDVELHPISRGGADDKLEAVAGGPTILLVGRTGFEVHSPKVNKVDGLENRFNAFDASRWGYLRRREVFRCYHGNPGAIAGKVAPHADLVSAPSSVWKDASSWRTRHWATRFPT